MATILLVDDEQLIRQLFQKVLEHDGHTVLIATNGREALETLRQQTPDLVMLDMLMPQMDGMSVLRLMRRNPDWVHIPVMFMTAVSDKQHVADAGLLGVRDYMLKAGFSLPMLRSRIAKYVQPVEDPSASKERQRLSAAVASLVE